jgi:hypothetical protein
MEEFMNRKLTVFCLFIFSLLIIISCLKENKETENQTDYNDIINYLEENRDNICKIGSGKAIMALHLEKEEEEFHNNRLTYFINILKEDELNKKKYFEEHKLFLDKFRDDSLHIKDDSLWAFYWSMELFDYRLYKSIENNFNNIKLPVKYIKDFNMNYYLMVNYDIINDKNNDT